MHKGLMAAALLAVAGVTACTTTPQKPFAYESRRPIQFDAAEARDWLNSYRGSRLSSVALDSALTAMAERQVRIMAERDKLSHSVDTAFASRVRAADLQGRSAENILYGAYTTAGAMRQWQASPEHDKNLLMPGATRFGIAVAQSNGPKKRVYWAMVIASAQPAPVPTMATGPVMLGADGQPMRAAPARGRTVLQGPFGAAITY